MRSMPHIHELYDFTISAYIVHKDKVLLVNHPRYAMWLPIGGHIELDEDPEQAFYREVAEESGLEVELLSTAPTISTPDDKFIPVPQYLNVHTANNPHKHITLVYFARATNNRFVMSAEHTDGRWLSLTELDDPKYGLSESIKLCCREAVKAATGAPAQ